MSSFTFDSDDYFGEYDGDVNVGDLLEIKKGMMLIEPIDPVLVLSSDNTKGIYEIMYTRNNYIIGCGRLEIKRVVQSCKDQPSVI